jgi:hypothetical protein
MVTGITTIAVPNKMNTAAKTSEYRAATPIIMGRANTNRQPLVA